ncbi:MAG: hypothetical protein U9Q07_02800 [Planctomycetota bacterium]|nr:hypothetical protein [Planctomycetota bacterium]
MNKKDVLYGFPGWETLEMEAEDAVERIVEDACETVGEDFGSIAKRISWPICLQVFKRMDTGGDTHAQSIAYYALDRVLDDLDADYGNPDSDQTDPTDKMEAAALAFGQAVLAEYVPWMCEQTGAVVMFTKKQALDMFEEATND